MQVNVLQRKIKNCLVRPKVNSTLMCLCH